MMMDMAHGAHESDDEHFYALERRLEGSFRKIMNNTSYIHITKGDVAMKMLAFAHCTVERYKGNVFSVVPVYLVDIVHGPNELDDENF